MMNKTELNELATGHWIYTKNIIVKSSHRNWNESDLDLMGYLYTEAFKHGYKHSVDETKRRTK